MQPGSKITLSAQQRGYLAEATRHEFVAASMFVGAAKGWAGRGRITAGSAQACLRRLATRGLLDQDDRNPAIFRINDEGKAALDATS